MTARLEPPAWYDPERRAIWAETLPQLEHTGVLDRPDIARILDVYVCAYASHTEAAKLLAQTHVLINRDGKAVPNPALDVQRQTRRDLAEAAKTLRLDRPPTLAATPDSPTVAGRWCQEHQRRECTRNRKDGTPCHRKDAYPGTGACYMHAGLRPDAARAKGKIALARVYGGPHPDIDPTEALLAQVRRSAAQVAALARLVAEIEAEAPGDGTPGSGGLWEGVSRQVTTDDGATITERKPGQHVVLKAYGEEQDRLVRSCLAARTVGAQESAIDAARALGAGAGRLLDAIFAALLLVPAELEELPGAAALVGWQRAQVPKVVPVILRQQDEIAG